MPDSFVEENMMFALFTFGPAPDADAPKLASLAWLSQKLEAPGNHQARIPEESIEYSTCAI